MVHLSELYKELKISLMLSRDLLSHWETTNQGGLKIRMLDYTA